MKRIAVAVEKDVVSGHFGLCENFLLFDTKEGHICKIEKFKNPGHRPCELPEFVQHTGANILITGRMGKAAADEFKKLDIPYIIGAQGEARAVVDAFLSGKLLSSGELCDAWGCEFFDHGNCPDQP
ncbi:MAG: NifB/NifX family molybdenum-iron cluster-binding protein [Sphaerochaetaceae bacterium]